MNSCNATIAAALASIEVLEKDMPYDRLFRYGKKLMNILQSAASRAGQYLLVQRPGPMINIAFTNLREARDYRDTLTFDKVKLGRFIAPHARQEDKDHRRRLVVYKCGAY